MKNKIKTLIFSLTLALQAFAAPLASADFLNVRAYGTDTVAGYASALKTSMINPGQNVVFVVEKPDFSVVRVPAQADLEGLAVADLYGHQTKTAGEYKVAVLFPGSTDSSPQSGFTVYAGPVSVMQSDLGSTSQMITADGKEKTFITATVFDEYRNPIKDHQIKLISSRSEDEISSINGGVTDGQGKANFKLSSKYPGISVVSALDVTVNQVLSDREEIVFYAPAQDDSIGGNYLSADLLNAADISQPANADVLPGPVNKFEIQGLSSNVKINTDQTITIIAKDKDGNTAKNYTGTILFSTPDDEHAVLPNNGQYTFTESDQGKFTFNLALRFSKTGNQTLQVFDKDNWKISGEKEIEVMPEQAAANTGISKNLLIKYPLDGAELGNSTIIVSGQGDTNIDLKVFDNDIKIGDSETDSDGFFTFQAQNLANGPHTFYVMSDEGYVSESVSIQIDTLPPVINDFEVSPEGIVQPGEKLTVTVLSEPNLEEVKIRIQGTEETLLPVGGQPGTYAANIAAPVIDGFYSIDVILIDSLANKAELLNKSSVQVSVPAPVYPPKVEEPEGAPGDSAVTVSWKSVTGHNTEIKTYRVYYGTELDKLDQKIDADGVVNSVTVKELENDKQYFFAVSAIDSKGVESEEKSTVIAVTPVSAEEDSGGDSGNNTGDSEPIDIIPDGTIQGESLSPGSVTLTWKPFSGVRAYFYKVYFGVNSGMYDDYAVTKDNKPEITINDLIPNLTYYFSVVALDLSGKEISPLSPEFSLVPSGTSFHHVSGGTDDGSDTPLDNDRLHKVPSTDKTGPETIWIIVISLVFAHFLYHHHRRRVRS